MEDTDLIGNEVPKIGEKGPKKERPKWLIPVFVCGSLLVLALLALGLLFFVKERPEKSKKTEIAKKEKQVARQLGCYIERYCLGKPFVHTGEIECKNAMKYIRRLPKFKGKQGSWLSKRGYCRTFIINPKPTDRYRLRGCFLTKDCKGLSFYDSFEPMPRKKCEDIFKNLGVAGSWRPKRYFDCMNILLPAKKVQRTLRRRLIRRIIRRRPKN